MRRTPTKSRSTRCPRCEFHYAWDGRFCEHCHYPHAKRTNWDEFRQLARFPYAHQNPNPRKLRLFGCACVRTLGPHLPPEANRILNLLEKQATRDAWHKAVHMANDLFAQLPEGPSATRDAARLLAILTQMIGGPAESNSAISYLVEPITPAMLGSVALPAELRQMMFQVAQQVAQMQAHVETPRHLAEAAEMPDFLAEVVRRHGWGVLSNLDQFRDSHRIPFLTAQQVEEGKRYAEARRLATDLVDRRRRTISDVESSQCDLYRDMFGYPFIDVTIPLTCITGTVHDIALSMFESSDFSAMPILGDALMDAGCEDGEIIAHCRRRLPHARGCWLLDRILNLG